LASFSRSLQAIEPTSNLGEREEVKAFRGLLVCVDEQESYLFLVNVKVRSDERLCAEHRSSLITRADVDDERRGCREKDGDTLKMFTVNDNCCVSRGNGT
jgi:hypothetical protein